ncbi:hypothetical protein [Thiosocius teredinicola]|uniref:hypothetical protein n=1 Tax=Thiosocius teredinicola TaxID=1973002 RepID=UPI000F7B6A9A
MRNFSNRVMQKGLIVLCALVPLFFAAVWIYTFGFTEYRAHQQWIGLPASFAMVGLSVGMLLFNRIALIASLILTVCAAVLASVFFYANQHWGYAVIFIVGVSYVFACSEFLWPTKDEQKCT